MSWTTLHSHFGETISGAPSIRAYNATARFIATNEDKIDINQTCYYPTFVANRWLAVRLEVIGNLVIFFAALFAVLSRNTLDGGDVGLSLSYSLTVRLTFTQRHFRFSNLLSSFLNFESNFNHAIFAAYDCLGRDFCPKTDVGSGAKFKTKQNLYLHYR